MNKLVLANIDYKRHMTSEGEQLQEGLRHAGWTLAGQGYGDHCRDVPTLLERHRPQVVFIQDPRDWDPRSDGSFRKDLDFTNIHALAHRKDITKVIVVKDAGTKSAYQRDWAQALRAQIILHYYHRHSVVSRSRWMASYKLVRIYHTIDRDECEQADQHIERAGTVVTGAVSNVYPLRARVIQHANALDIKVRQHPGYHNQGHCTMDYLRVLSTCAAHIATSSAYKFALRKIIESVAMGTTPITDLPDYDALPEIDGALVRIRSDISIDDLRTVIRDTEAGWNAEERAEWARKAREWYDYRTMGERTDAAIVQAITGN